MQEKKIDRPLLVAVIVAAEAHTHAGKAVKKGDKIDVTPEQREWLLKHNIIEA